METRALIEQTTDDGPVLGSPTVGIWRASVQAGDALPAGRVVGTLEILGRRVGLTVPAGVRGVAKPVGGTAPRPVGYGDVLLDIGEAVGLEDAATQAAGPAKSADGYPVEAPLDGIFYRRPAPDQPNFVEVGSTVTKGTVLGLLEVMKTFHPVTYGGPGLPPTAKVVGIVAKDQQEVAAGDPLVVVSAD